MSLISSRRRDVSKLRQVAPLRYVDDAGRVYNAAGRQIGEGYTPPAEPVIVDPWQDAPGLPPDARQVAPMVWQAADGTRLDATGRPLEEYAGPPRKAPDISSLRWGETRCVDCDRILVEADGPVEVVNAYAFPHQQEWRHTSC